MPWSFGRLAAWFATSSHSHLTTVNPGARSKAVIITVLPACTINERTAAHAPLAVVLNQIHHCILNRSSHATPDFCIAAIAYLSSGWYSFLQQYFRVLVPRRLRQGQHASNLSCLFCSRRTNKFLLALESLGTFIQIDFKLELITSSTVPPMRPWKSAGSYGTNPYWDTVLQAMPMFCFGSIRPLNMLLAVPSDQ